MTNLIYNSIRQNLSEAEINNTPYTAADTFNPSYPILGTLLCLISGGVFYAILLYRLDYRMSIKQDFSRWRNRFSLIPQAAPQVTKEDDSISIDVDRQRMEDVVLVQETNRLKRGELTEEDVVVVQGLGKTFLDRTGGKKNVKVLEDLWMAVRTKECFGYLGPNGAGKTTTIKVRMDAKLAQMFRQYLHLTISPPITRFSLVKKKLQLGQPALLPIPSFLSAGLSQL